MKRRDLVKRLEAAGFRLLTGTDRGGKHDKYVRGNDTEMIPRHKEIGENTAKGIIRKWGI